jgi:hypothetical protein
MWMEKALGAAKLDIFTTLTRRDDKNAPKTATLNIAATQRLVLAYLQLRFANEAAKLYDGQLTDGQAETVVSDLAENIHTYCKLALCCQEEPV